MELKDRIKDLRNERYLTQADITKAIGVGHSLLIVDP
jgi:DNA-binding XRE family transcriptional regulator